MTPLIEGGSLAGILEWRAGSAAPGSGSGSGHSRRRRRHAAPDGALDEDETKAVVIQVLDGLAYLHANGFLHVRSVNRAGDRHDLHCIAKT